MASAGRRSSVAGNATVLTLLPFRSRAGGSRWGFAPAVTVGRSSGSWASRPAGLRGVSSIVEVHARAAAGRDAARCASDQAHGAAAGQRSTHHVAGADLRAGAAAAVHPDLARRE